MHLDLENFNLMLEGKATKEEHLNWTEHLLECPACQRDFRMLRELHAELAPKPKRNFSGLWRVASLAAVLVLAVWPIFHSSNEEEIRPEALATPETLQLLEQVKQVNTRREFANWGDQHTVVDLIKKT